MAMGGCSRRLLFPALSDNAGNDHVNYPPADLEQHVPPEPQASLEMPLEVPSELQSRIEVSIVSGEGGYACGKVVLEFVGAVFYIVGGVFYKLNYIGLSKLIVLFVIVAFIVFAKHHMAAFCLLSRVFM